MKFCKRNTDFMKDFSACSTLSIIYHLCRPRKINPEDRGCSRKRVKSSAAHTSIDRAARVRENMSRTKRIETFSGTRDKASARR